MGLVESLVYNRNHPFISAGWYIPAPWILWEIQLEHSQGHPPTHRIPVGGSFLLPCGRHDVLTFFHAYILSMVRIWVYNLIGWTIYIEKSTDFSVRFLRNRTKNSALCTVFVGPCLPLRLAHLTVNKCPSGEVIKYGADESGFCKPATSLCLCVWGVLQLGKFLKKFWTQFRKDVIFGKSK